MNVTCYATITAEVPQVIHCRHCRREFLYRMRKSGKGMAEPFPFVSTLEDAERKAAEIARGELAAKLTPDSLNVVPCRYCWRFQPFMREQAARQRYGADRYAGIFIACLGLIAVITGAFLLQWQQYHGVGVWVTVAGAGAIPFGAFAHWFVRRLVARYDPNSQSEMKRRRLAEERCLTWDEFNHDQAKRLVQTYQEYTGLQGQSGPAETENSKSLPALWLPSRDFVNGRSIPVRLAPNLEVTIEVAADTEPGKVIDLVPGDSHRHPFQIVLLAISDYYNDPLDDEG